MSAYNMELAYAWMNMLFYVLNHFFSRQRVGAFFALVFAEITKSTVCFTNVSEVETHVFNEIHFLAVLPQVGFIGQLAESQQIIRLIQIDAVFYAKPYAVLHFLNDFRHSFVCERCYQCRHFVSSCS